VVGPGQVGSRHFLGAGDGNKFFFHFDIRKLLGIYYSSNMSSFWDPSSISFPADRTWLKLVPRRLSVDAESRISQMWAARLSAGNSYLYLALGLLAVSLVLFAIMGAVANSL
jgi:hypothetical protein